MQCVFFSFLFFLYWPLTTLLITSASTTCRNVHTDALRCIFIQNTCIFFTYICIRSSQDGPSCSPHWQKKKHLQRIYWTDILNQHRLNIWRLHAMFIITMSTQLAHIGQDLLSVGNWHKVPMYNCCIKKRISLTATCLHCDTWTSYITLCIQNLYLYVTRDSNICECTATKTGFLCYFHYRHLCAAICLRAWNTTGCKKHNTSMAWVHLLLGNCFNSALLFPVKFHSVNLKQSLASMLVLFWFHIHQHFIV